MTTRQKQLLNATVKAYVDSAEPISSGQLAKETGLDVSSATIRNELMTLENEGYLEQPHTSAGRIPTEKTWRWYVSNLLEHQDVTRVNREHLLDVMRHYRHEQSVLVRRLAKTLAELAEETVLLAPGPHETYYTGLSNLFRQPEFEQVQMVQAISRVVDRFDEILGRLYERLEEDVCVLIGKDNPFGSDTGAVIVRYHLPHRPHGIIGILGPLRQDYGQHVAMLSFTAAQLERVHSDTK